MKRRVVVDLRRKSARAEAQSSYTNDLLAVPMIVTPSLLLNCSRCSAFESQYNTVLFYILHKTLQLRARRQIRRRPSVEHLLGARDRGKTIREAVGCPEKQCLRLIGLLIFRLALGLPQRGFREKTVVTAVSRGMKMLSFAALFYMNNNANVTTNSSTKRMKFSGFPQLEEEL